ncbi:MAG: RNA degradosome polyphosphate kinase, partial [Acidobacteria bacterium]|nr:RNA degradosome polyphosphate kinase [Acidobacteriota bacterium]
MARLPLDNSTYYINRETSWLAFNGRVLEEAQDPTNPLLERVKFLAITASNLDEFFEVRVAGLLQRIEDGYTEAGIDGLTPQEEAGLLAPQLHEFVRDQYACWNEQLRPALAENGVHVLHMRDLDGEARDFAARY